MLLPVQLKLKWSIKEEWPHEHASFFLISLSSIRLRVLSAQVATFVTGAKKGKPFGKRFFDLPAFTRIGEWPHSLPAKKAKGKCLTGSTMPTGMNSGLAPDLAMVRSF